VENSTCRSKRRTERVLFGALLILHLAPILALDRVATQDGPSHVANARIVNHLLSDDCPAVSEYFSLQLELFPNWVAPLLLVGLTRLSPDSVPDLAEKLVQIAYVLALAFAMRWSIRRIEPENEFLALAVFPLIYAYPFAMGFYAFSIGLPLLLLWVGHWAEHREHFDARAGAVLAFLGLLTFYAHPLPYAAAGVFLAALILSRILVTLHSARRAGAAIFEATRTAFRSLWIPAMALVPSALLLLLYAQNSGSSLLQVGEAFTHSVSLAGFRSDFWRILGSNALVTHDARETIFAFANTLALGCATLYGLLGARRHPPHALSRGLALATLIFLVLFFVVSDFISWGGYIRVRIQLLFWMALILWLATRRFGLHAGRLFQAAILVSALGLLGIKVLKFQEVNVYLAEYLSAAEVIEPGHTVLPLNFLPGEMTRGGGPAFRIDPLLHASGYLVAGRCLVSLDNYEANAKDHFPTRFRPGLEPYSTAGYSEYRPERVDLTAYAAATGRPIDYLLSWGAEQAIAWMGEERGEAIRRQLQKIERDYDLAYVSEGRGWLRLYRRKPALPNALPRRAGQSEPIP
jgi:hypothetical protein